MQWFLDVSGLSYSGGWQVWNKNKLVLHFKFTFSTWFFLLGIILVVGFVILILLAILHSSFIYTERRYWREAYETRQWRNACKFYRLITLQHVLDQLLSPSLGISTYFNFLTGGWGWGRRMIHCLSHFGKVFHCKFGLAKHVPVLLIHVFQSVCVIMITYHTSVCSWPFCWWMHCTDFTFLHVCPLPFLR